MSLTRRLGLSLIPMSKRAPAARARANSFGIAAHGQTVTLAKHLPGFPEDPTAYADPVNLVIPLTSQETVEHATVAFEAQLSKYLADEPGARAVANRILKAQYDAFVLPPEASAVYVLATDERLKKKVTAARKVSRYTQQPEALEPYEVAKRVVDLIDEQVIKSSVVLDADATERLAPEPFGVEDWDAYRAGFEARNGADVAEVAALFKLHNVDGYHDHDLDPAGAHWHCAADTLDGSHTHDELNPYGLHIHKSGDTPGGPHTHTLSNKLGVHAHGLVNEDGSWTDEQFGKSLSKSMILRGLEALRLRKGIANAAQAVFMSLKSSLCDLRCNGDWIYSGINRKSRDINRVRFNNVYISAIKMLEDDLSFVSFKAGMITAVPQPIMVPTKKFFVQKDPWDVEAVNRYITALNGAVYLLGAAIELVPEGPEFDGFRQQLEDVLTILMQVQTDLPGIIQTANDLQVVRVYTGDVPDQLMPMMQQEVNFQLGKRATQTVNEIEDLGEYRIEKVDKSRRMVKGVVLQPDIVDLQGQWIGADAIEEAMEKFMENYQQIGLMHTQFNKNAGFKDKDFVIIENYITKKDEEIGGKLVPAGSWVMTTKIKNDKIWARILKGELTGYSVGGYSLIKPGKKVS